MKKHILVVSQRFFPENFRINDICTTWVKEGYKVTVVTGIPNYPQGKFYDGYGFFKKTKETYNGIDIIRLPVIPRGTSKLGMIFDYAAFTVSGFFWALFTKIKCDYIFNFETSPMTQSLIPVWYKRRFKVPYYLYVQDLWPENVEIVGNIHNKFIIGAIDKMVKHIYDRADKVFATSESFVKAIRDRMIKDTDKVSYWPQYAEEFYSPKERTIHDDIFRVGFTGNIGVAQGLDVLPKCAEVLKNKGVNKVKFLIVGEGRYKEQFVKDIKDRNVEEYFEFTGYVAGKEVPGILANCDCAFISFLNNDLFNKTIPAKLQSYMSCGKAILACSGGETERIVKEANCGYYCANGDYNALAHLIENMVNDPSKLEKMGSNSIEYVKTHFNKKELMDEMMRNF